MSPTTRHLWGTDYPIIAKIDDHYDLIAHENGPALAVADHLCVIDIRTSDEPHLQELKAKAQKEKAPVSSYSPYVITIADIHGTTHTFGPIDLPDQITDQGETWDNIAAMESTATDYVRDAAECSLYLPSQQAQGKASTSAELYRLLEYYRNFMPFCVGMSEKAYSETQEAKNADAALTAYRKETGAEADTKPSEPNAKELATPLTGDAETEEKS